MPFPSPVFSASRLTPWGPLKTVDITLGRVGDAHGLLIYPTEATANIWKMHEECFQFGDSTFNRWDCDFPRRIRLISISQRRLSSRSPARSGSPCSLGMGSSRWVKRDCSRRSRACLRTPGWNDCGPSGSLSLPSGHRDQRE